MVALMATLSVPMAARGRHSITIPAPKSNGPAPVFQNKLVAIPRLGCLVSRIDQLITLSCHNGGLESLFHSAFFNRDITCHVAGGWLQGALAVLEVIEDGGDAASTLMLRDPAIGAIWTGAYVTGAHRHIFSSLRRGHWVADLIAAAATGTLQSFIQLPATPAARRATNISWMDEVLFKVRTYGFRRLFSTTAPPVPPGRVVSMEVIDQEVQKLPHASHSHLTVLRSFAWIDGKSEPRGIAPMAMPLVRMRKNGDELDVNGGPQSVYGGGFCFQF